MNQQTAPPKEDQSLQYLAAEENPADYKDACETCIRITHDPDEYRAMPYLVYAIDREGLVAFYLHGCGTQWWCSWAYINGPK